MNDGLLFNKKSNHQNVWLKATFYIFAMCKTDLSNVLQCFVL